MSGEPWHCEECGEQFRGPPASSETVTGYDGDVELWFCDECTRYER